MITTHFLRPPRPHCLLAHQAKAQSSRMASFTSVDQIEKHVATRSYITGYSFSADDKAAYGKLTAFPSRASHPNAYRWAVHVAALVGPAGAVLGAAPTAGSKGAAAPAANADDLDLFGDDDEETAEEKAASKARHDRMENARKLKEDADKKAGKVKKEKEAERSLVVLEVKPWEADTDLEMVWRKIIEYQQNGLTWGQTFKLEPVAYGIKKLVLTCTIVDALVLMDDITDNIEALEDYVQSVNVASMNKI